MECPECGEMRVQFRSKNNQTSVIKYKCLECGRVFTIKEEDIISDYII